MWIFAQKDAHALPEFVLGVTASDKWAHFNRPTKLEAVCYSYWFWSKLVITGLGYNGEVIEDISPYQEMAKEAYRVMCELNEGVEPSEQVIQDAVNWKEYA